VEWEVLILGNPVDIGLLKEQVPGFYWQWVPYSGKPIKEPDARNLARLMRRHMRLPR
jgi:hypothetical protein